MDTKKLRKFENFTSFVDDLGEPLYGRIRFKVDSTDASVYDVDGTDIGSYVFTDEWGRCSTQVFLEKTKTYEVHFDKYIGHGSMTDDFDDTECWEEVGSCTDYATHSESSEAQSSVLAVANISTLRNTFNVEDGTIIDVLGYNEEGDKPTVRYVWDSTSIEDDDGGSTIGRQDENGRWKLIVSNGIVDVRDFGVFAKTTHDYDGIQCSRINVASQFAYTNGYKLAFYEDGLYDITSIGIRNVIAGIKAKFYCHHGMTASIIDVNPEVQFYSWVSDNDENESVDGTITLKANCIRMSSLNGHYNVIPNTIVSFIFDMLITDNITWTINNVDVYIHANVNKGVIFNNCNIVPGLGKIQGASRFIGCHVPLDVFESDSVVDNSTFISCEFVWGDAIYQDVAKYKALTRNGGKVNTSFRNLYAENLSADNIAVEDFSAERIEATEQVTTPILNSNNGTVAINGNAQMLSGRCVNNFNVGGSVIATGGSHTFYGLTTAYDIQATDGIVVGDATGHITGDRFYVNGTADLAGLTRVKHIQYRAFPLSDVTLASFYCEVQDNSHEPMRMIRDLVKYCERMNFAIGETICLYGGSDQFNESAEYVLSEKRVQTTVGAHREVMYARIKAHDWYFHEWNPVSQQSDRKLCKADGTGAGPTDDGSYQIRDLPFGTECIWVTYWGPNGVSVITPATLQCDIYRTFYADGYDPMT